MTRAPALIIALVLCIAFVAFFTWGVGRALDYEARCSQLSGQCETP